MRDKNWNQSFDHIETRYGRIITGLGITLKLELSLLHCYEVVQLELVGSGSNPKTLGRALGLNLITRLSVTFGSKSYKGGN